MEKQTEPIAVDTKTAQQMLGLGRSSVLALADRGELTRLHFGRSIRYPYSDVVAAVERRRSASQAAAEEAGLFRLSPPDPAA